MSSPIADEQAVNSRLSAPQFKWWRFKQVHFFYGAYAVALAIAISIWFIPIRLPLWLDETASYWQISAGLSGIWTRQFPNSCFPAYTFLLWLWVKAAGTGVVTMRIPSVLAMLGAVYFLYLAACELFDREFALITAVIFCVNPFITFEATDVRPYACAVLLTNAAIFIILRMRHNRSNWLAVVLGITLACILYFHYLFAPILLALVVCLLAFSKGAPPKTFWRQFGIAAAIFGLTSLPMIPGLHYLFSTSGTHVSASAPRVSDLLWTLAPGILPFIFASTAFGVFIVVASSGRRGSSFSDLGGTRILICVSLALIPLLILFGVSVATPIQIFSPYHRSVAVPGIALCWALAVSVLPFRSSKLLFCVALVGITAYISFFTPAGHQHGASWKYALDTAEKNASIDNASVLICSPLPESNYAPMPLNSAKTSFFFLPLSYYNLSVPVVPLPNALNQESVRVATQFLRVATRYHRRFLALADERSYGTLNWLTSTASGNYTVHKLGVFDTVEVLEFSPRN